MRTTNIQWKRTLPEALNQERYAHFFLLVRNHRVIFIGQCFRKPLEDFIPFALNGLGIEGGNVELWLGRIKDVGSGRLEAQLIKDLENLLVYSRKPVMNKEYKLSYKGQSKLRILNSGCSLLNVEIRAENNMVFRSLRMALEGYSATRQTA